MTKPEKAPPITPDDVERAIEVLRDARLWHLDLDPPRRVEAWELDAAIGHLETFLEVVGA